MSTYALIIGIDVYKNAEWNLNSAVDDALAFADWAVTKGGVKTHDLTLLLSPQDSVRPEVTLRNGADVPFGTADSKSIVLAVNRLAEQRGARVFVYFAGHGCSAPGSRRDDFPEPVLIPSDAANLVTDYKVLLGYSELQHPLLESGPDEQFFFFDACRDFRLEDHERGAGSAVGPKRGKCGRRPQYLLCAASPGERANELGKGIFSDVLLDALSGFTAVSFNPRSGQFDLTFQGLSQFVVQKVSSRIEQAFPIGSAEFVQKPQPLLPKEKPDTIVASFDPAQVPRFPITIRISPSSVLARSGIEVYYYTPEGEFLVQPASLPPPLDFPAQTQLRPGDYSLRVVSPETFTPGRLSITIPKELEFDIELVQAPPSVTLGRGVAPAGPPKTLIFQSRDRNIPLIVERPDTDALVVGISDIMIDNPPIGIYKVRLVLPEGPTPTRLVDFPRDGNRFEIAPPPPKVSARQLDAVAAIGMKSIGEAYIQPSELIGPLADTNLPSLLALAAYATYSYKDPAYMNKLRNLGLRQIPGVQSAAGWVSVLLGATGTQPVGLSPLEFLSGSIVAVTDYMETIHGRGVPSPIPNLPAAAEFRCECPAGPKCIELRLPGFNDTRYATVVLTNHITVLVIVANDDSTIDVQQYVLPLSVDSSAPAPTDMRIIELAQRFYANSDRVPEYVIDRLLEAKFVDPILGCLAGYLLVRQGEADRYRGDPRPSPGNPRLTLSPMLNMLRLFEGIPDSHVLAGLADVNHQAEHFANAAARGLPLFMEGVAALFSAKDSKLDPFLQSFHHSLLVGSPWTAWIAREPVLDLANGYMQTPPKSWTILENVRTQIETLATSVGAVRKVDRGVSATVGTAFVIDGRRAITSRRVADEIAEETSGQWRLKPNLAAFVNFGENPVTTTQQFQISEIHVVPEAHLSIITVQESFQASPLEQADTSTSISVLDGVYLIGYPVSDSRGDPAVATKMVRSTAGVKRILPGIILEISPDGKSLDHSCFTLTGSGGSPVIQLSTGKVIGVHWGGWKRSYGRGRAALIHAQSKWL